MSKKLISLLMALTVFAGVMTLTGCSNVHKLKDQVYGYFENRIRLLLKGEYEQQFKDGLTAEDLAFDNIGRHKSGEPTINRTRWFTNGEPHYGSILVDLEKCGEQEVEEAIEYFSSLDYVLRAEKIIGFVEGGGRYVEHNRGLYYTSFIKAKIKPEYRNKFINREFDSEIKWDNFLVLKYDDRLLDEGYYPLMVYLKRTSYEDSMAALEYVKTLYFVEEATNIWDSYSKTYYIGSN